MNSSGAKVNNGHARSFSSGNDHIACRANKERPCEVCGSGTKGCSVTHDDRRYCRGEPRNSDEWRFLKEDDAGFKHYRRITENRRSIQNVGRRQDSVSNAQRDWPSLARRYVEEFTREKREELAKILKLPTEAFSALPFIGFDSQEACWTFPEVDPSNQIIGLSRRFRDGSKKSMKGGSRGLTLPSDFEAKKAEGPLFVVEGPSDVLAGIHAGLPCVGRPSNSGGRDLLMALVRGTPGQQIIVLGENDKKPNGDWPGKAAQSLAGNLSRVLGAEVLWALPPDGSKDIRAWLTDTEMDDTPWRDRGKKLQRLLLESAKELASELKSGDDIKLQIKREDEKKGKYVVIAFDGASEVHRDTFDLNTSNRRKKFIREVLDAAEVNDDRSKIVTRLDQELRQAASITPSKPPPVPNQYVDPRIAKLEEMTLEVRERAAAILKNPNLINWIQQSMEEMGFVGERENRLILYFVGTSAQLKKPLNAIVRGASSSGKSYLCEQISKMFPPEVVLSATRITPNALYHFSEHELRHRLIVSGERSHSEKPEDIDKTKALREMMETGKLSISMPEKSHDAKMITVTKVKEGPIAYIETTTRSKVLDEDENRCLLLNTDEGPEQTERIVNSIAQKYQGRKSESSIIEIHHAIQRMIPRVEVRIPFARAIGNEYPKIRLEVRREFGQLLQLLSASALLHYRQREIDSEGRVVATYADYEEARKLARGPFGTTATGISSSASNFFSLLKTKLCEKNQGSNEFTASDVKDVGGHSSRTISNRLRELARAGAIEQTEPQRGQIPAKWRLKELSLEDLENAREAIPTVGNVMNEDARCQRADKV